MIVTIAALGPTVGWGDGALVVGVVGSVGAVGIVVRGDGSADGILVDGDDPPADGP